MKRLIEVIEANPNFVFMTEQENGMLTWEPAQFYGLFEIDNFRFPVIPATTNESGALEFDIGDVEIYHYAELLLEINIDKDLIDNYRGLWEYCRYRQGIENV